MAAARDTSTSLSMPNGHLHKPLPRNQHKKIRTNQTMIIHSSDEEHEIPQYQEQYTQPQYKAEQLYGDDMDDMSYDDQQYDEQPYEDEIEQYDDEEWYEDNEYDQNNHNYNHNNGYKSHNNNPKKTKKSKKNSDTLSALQDDWDENYTDYYEDTDYAQAPPKKKKYRESDANIKPLSYTDAKKQKTAETKDKFEKRYSKYDDIIIFDTDDNEYEYELPHKIKKKKKKHKHKKKRSSGIELSVTNEINELSVESKEVSIFYNKKTKDKYNEFEMNTYSSDSTSDSDKITSKYLKNNPITPAPEVMDKKYELKLGGYKDNEEKPVAHLKLPTKMKEKHRRKAKKKITLKEFMSVNLSRFVLDNDGDNFDVAKAICKYYDIKCGDTDTVTIVSDSGQGPNTAYWSKGDYNRVETDCLGKYIMVYRACKHVTCQTKVAQDIFESCVKGLCMDNLGHSQLIADKLDCVFGEGCHVSLASHDQFEVFCRYSDGYICEVEIPATNGHFVVAWRR